jgi:hypothetical protein
MGQSVRAQTGFEVISFAPLVSAKNVELWGNFSSSNSKHWLAESRDATLSLAAQDSTMDKDDATLLPTNVFVGNVNPSIFDYSVGIDSVSQGTTYSFIPSVVNRPGGPYFPSWMMTPPPFTSLALNVDSLSYTSTAMGLASAVIASRIPLMTQVTDITALSQSIVTPEDHEKYHLSLVDYTSNSTQSAFQHPHAPYVYPIFENSFESNSRLVAAFVAIAPIDRYLINLLPKGVSGIHVVVQTCELHFTYLLDGNSVSNV